MHGRVSLGHLCMLDVLEPVLAPAIAEDPYTGGDPAEGGVVRRPDHHRSPDGRRLAFEAVEPGRLV